MYVNESSDPVSVIPLSTNGEYDLTKKESW
jgi:hypothetical protein